MLEEIWRGADLVLGSRYLPGGGSDGWPLHRRIASRIGGFASSLALGLPYTDLSGGFKLWRASALAAIDVASTRSQGYVIPFTFRDRRAGESKMEPAIAIEGMRMVAQLRRDAWSPQRAASAVRTAAYSESPTGA